MDVTEMLELKRKLEARRAVAPQVQTQTLTWAGKPVEFQAIAFNNPRDWWANIGPLKVDLQLHGVLYFSEAKMSLAVEDSLAYVQGHDTAQESLDALHKQLLDVVAGIAGALAPARTVPDAPGYPEGWKV